MHSQELLEKQLSISIDTLHLWYLLMQSLSLLLSSARGLRINNLHQILLGHITLTWCWVEMAVTRCAWKVAVAKPTWCVMITTSWHAALKACAIKFFTSQEIAVVHGFPHCTKHFSRMTSVPIVYLDWLDRHANQWLCTTKNAELCKISLEDYWSLDNEPDI